MTRLEQFAALVMQIRNLRARIESAGDDCFSWEEEWQLRCLEERFDRLKGGGGFGKRKPVCHS